MIPNDYHTYDAAVRGEVTDRLDAFPGAVYDDSDVALLANRLIMPRTNGTYTGTPDPSELFTLAKAIGVLRPEPPVDCSVEWCKGTPYSHGADGRDESEYKHESNCDALAPHEMLIGWFTQTSDLPPFYEMTSQPSPRDAAFLLTPSEVRELAEEFERHAATLRERATQLEAFGGIQ